MTLAEGAIAGIGLAFDLNVLPFLGIGALFGLLIGVIPGLSGHFAMAIAISFLYAMEPAPGIAFLLAAHATVAQGGGLTAILFSTPGTGQNAATLLDGPKMRDNGEAGVAIGAAMAACFFGACFGAFVLALLIPVLREVVLMFGPPEIFMLAVLGLIFVATIGRRDLVRSLIAGLLGLFLALIGVDNATNAPRFNLGTLELSDGLSLVPVVLGLFAVAEMIALWSRGGSLNPDRSTLRSRQGQVFQGIVLAVRNWWLVIRCSSIGTVMGIIPGLGSASAAFVAYGHARATSRSPETFEHGNVEGVIAPEAANDAVEGGALASTVAFGIPGSSSMAILLSGLTILGLETGPRMLNEDLSILFLMICTIIIGNFIGTIAGLFLSNPLMLLTSIPSGVMAPAIVSIVVCSAYAHELSLFDVFVVICFGALGYICSLLRYSRAALLIGFVLGHPIEYNLYLSIQLKGAGFLLEPIPLVLGSLGLLFLARSVWGIVKDQRAAQPSPTGKMVPEAVGDPATTRRLLRIEAVFVIVVGVFATMAIFETLFIGRGSVAIPMVVLVPLAGLIALQLRRVASLSKQLPGARRSQESNITERSRSLGSFLLALFLLPVVVVVFGHYGALLLFLLFVLRLSQSGRMLQVVLPAILITFSIYILFETLLNIRLFQGLMLRFLSGYSDFSAFDLNPIVQLATGAA